MPLLVRLVNIRLIKVLRDAQGIDRNRVSSEAAGYVIDDILQPDETLI